MTHHLLELDDRYLLQNYTRSPIVFERGEGCRLWDTEGRRYLDFLAGIAVCALGHSHPDWVEAVRNQAARLVHVSGFFHNVPQALLAERLVQLSGMDRVFFCNSGTEANEAAIKISRKWGKAKRGPECYRIVCFRGGFHGRTYGSLSATPNPKYQDPFAPLVPGFVALDRHDFDGLDRALDGTTCAVMIEPIQGEGGVMPTDPRCLQELRRMCDEREVLLIGDEVQTGIGRTGKWFDFQNAGVLPDLMPLAKGLGGGFPIGAILARGEAATTFVPGDHGSTYSGNPLACAAALAVIEVIQRDGLLAQVIARGEQIERGVEAMASRHQAIDHLRGRGLLRGLVLREPIAKRIVHEALEMGLVLNATDETTLRLAPPLIVGHDEVDEALGVIEQALTRVGAGAAR
jgi:predicted acetylornithine/succinylornithine family transaminase